MAFPAVDRGGFTLIELLVAMVIGSVVVGSLFQMISGQGRFVELQSAREEVQQNSRAALELIGSELRTLPGGEALVQATADSVTIRAPRVWGVVCAVGAASLDVTLPSIPGGSYAVNNGTGLAANVGTAEAPVWTNGVRATAIGAAASDCNGSVIPTGSERRRITLTALPQSGGAPPTLGSIVYLYDQVTYRTGTSAGVPGLWIQRRAGDVAGSTNQPLAGPVREGGEGLSFEYYSDASSAPLATPIVDAATRATVTRISVAVETLSRNRAGNEQEARSDTVMISLRNRL